MNARVTQPDPSAAGPFSCVALAWQTHEAELRGYLRHRMPSAAAADDVLQDVFVKAMRQGQGFCALSNPRAWLFQVARNALVDLARSSRPVEPLPDELPAPEPESASAVDELAECLSSCMAELSAQDAEILRACDLQGQTTRAFAQARNLTLPAAKSRLSRARQRLRAQMTSSCQVRFDTDGRVDGHTRRSKGPQAA